MWKPCARKQCREQSGHFNTHCAHVRLCRGGQRLDWQQRAQGAAQLESAVVTNTAVLEVTLRMSRWLLCNTPLCVND